MSYYYTYYLAIKTDKGLMPFGPFDRKGFLHSVLSESSSYSSELYNNFAFANTELITDELLKSLLTEQTYNEIMNADTPYSNEEVEEFKKYFDREPAPKRNKKQRIDELGIKICCLNDLPKGDDEFEKGYITTKELEDYEMYGVVPEDFISSVEYAEKFKSAAIQGIPLSKVKVKKYDDYGNDYEVLLAELTYCVWKKTENVLNDANKIRAAYDEFWGYSERKEDIVVILMEG